MSSAAVRFCSQCGAENSNGGKFCAFCGHPLTGEEESDTLPPEYILKQRFRILEIIGQGGFGTIYKAEDTTFHHALRAIKEMRAQNLNKHEEQQAVAAFQSEASMLAGLMHPHLPRIYDHFEDHGRWYLVMDYIEGHTLDDILQQIPGHAIPTKQALQYALQMCDVLHYLHTRQPPIIFRDLKPANIMVTTDGDFLYLIDFGIARLFKPGQARDTLVLGSPGYAAPEQYGKAQTTERADIYSLGATLHHMLTGYDPEEDPFHFPPLDIPRYYPIGESLSRLITSMTQMSKEQRPDNIQSVRQELQHLEQMLTGNPSQLSQAATTTTSLPISTTSAPHRATTVQQATASANTTPVPLPQPPSITQKLSTFNLIHTAIKPLYIYRKHTAPVKEVQWSSNNKYIASRGVGFDLQTWAVSTGERYLADNGLTLAWSPDNKRAALAKARFIEFINTTNWRQENVWRKVPPVKYIRWSPNGLYILLIESESPHIHILDAQSGQVLTRFTQINGNVTTASWSPDGVTIASGGTDQQISLWKAYQGRTVLSYKHGGEITDIVWAPSGRRIASIGAGLHIWDATTGKTERIYTYRDGGDPATVTWSPEGQRIAFPGQEDGTVEIWHVQTGQQLSRYTGFQQNVLAIAWSPDGQSIASGCQDQNVYVWQAPEYTQDEGATRH